MRGVKGDKNGTASRNNSEKVGLVSVLGRAHQRTLQNVNGVGTRPLVLLILQSACTSMCLHIYITELSLNVTLSNHLTLSPTRKLQLYMYEDSTVS